MTVTISARRCRICHGTLDSLLDLGPLHLSGFHLPSEKPAPLVPHHLSVCSQCRTVQLAHTVNREAMFTEYWYKSGINEVMVDELMHVVVQALNRVTLNPPHDLVLDIGANDGTLLLEYPKHVRNVTRVGIEPASNLQADLVPRCEVGIHDYFPPHPLDLLKGMAGRCKIITSIACFYAADDPGLFVATVKELLHPEGVWVLQFQDLAQMCRTTAFDNIVSEHLLYYSLASIERLLQPYDLHVTFAERRAINGGSYRLTVQHQQQPEDASVQVLRAFEYGCEEWDALEQFAWKTNEVRVQLLSTISEALAHNQVIDLYAASTKSNTLTQYCALGSQVIRQAWERSPAKWGRLTATGIPVVSEHVGRANPPDVLLLGAWQFRDAFIERETLFLEAGGAMLVPLPQMEIVRRFSHVSRGRR